MYSKKNANPSILVLFILDITIFVMTLWGGVVEVEAGLIMYSSPLYMGHFFFFVKYNPNLTDKWGYVVYQLTCWPN